MQALVVSAPGELAFGELPDPVPGPGEVLVEIKAAALNRRDLSILAGRDPSQVYPFAPGSDGAGIRRDTGEEVVIFPSLRWGPREEHPAGDFRIYDGTLAGLAVVPESNISPKPRRLSWTQAAAIPLAGVTAYRALFPRAQLRAGETVLVLGIGSGVSTIAVQLAVQAGARVLVTSSSPAKLERSRRLGADAGVLYTQAGWVDEIRELSGGGVDVVVDSVGSTWPESLAALRGGGRLVVFGASGGTEALLRVRPFFFGQHSLLGTLMGSPKDWREFLAMVEAGSWLPEIDSVRPLADGVAAYERMRANEHMGKLVLQP